MRTGRKAGARTEGTLKGRKGNSEGMARVRRGQSRISWRTVWETRQGIGMAERRHMTGGRGSAEGWAKGRAGVRTW